MLKSDIPWLADGYRSDLKSSEEVEKEIFPHDEDSFSLCPDEYLENYANIRVSTPVQFTRNKPRVKSAHSRLSYKEIQTEKSRASTVQRPFSARPPSVRTTVRRQIKSAGTRSVSSQYSLWSKARCKTPDLYPEYFGHDTRGGLVVDYRPHSRVSHVSRHSCCFDHPSEILNEPRYSRRLQYVCDLPTGTCPTIHSSRPISARSYRSGVDGGLETEIAYRTQRYIDYHRPQTYASGEGYEHPSKEQLILKGYTPHFCSFVQKVPLHDRPSSSCHKTPRQGWEEEVDDDGNGGDLSDTSFMDFSSRKSFSFSTSGMDGRPSSPSSLGNDDDEDGIGGKDDGLARRRGDQTLKNRGSGIKMNVTITSTGDDKNGKKSEDKKGVIKFGFPVSKPHQPWASKPKSKKPVTKKPVIKKPKKESSSVLKSKTSKSSDIKTPPTVTIPDAVQLLEKLSEDEENKDDVQEESYRTPRSEVEKKEKKTPEKKVKPEVTPLPIIVDDSRVVEDVKPEIVVKPEKKPDPLPDVPNDADVPVPDLPKLKTPEPPKEPKSPSQLKQRSQISTPVSNKQPKQEQESEPRSRPEFDLGVAMDTHVEESAPKSKLQSWLHGRLALSQQSSRFELPMDMKLLESMSPLEYLRRHCVISTRRQNLYQKMFMKHKDKSGVIPLKDLEKSLNDVLVNAVNTQQLEGFRQLLEIPDDLKLDVRLFSCVAALIERLLYPKFVTVDTADLPQFQKEKLECADFCALDWKFHGVKVNPPVERLLKSL